MEHRKMAVSLFNRTRDLLDKKTRTKAEDDRIYAESELDAIEID